MTLLALIPARGGSKGIPRKNIRPFCGKPLLQWSIDAALASACVDQVVVSTDDEEIAEVAKCGGADVPFLRPAEHASDTAPGIAPVLHALQELSDVDDLLLLQPTSPLRTSTDIEAIFDLRKKANSASAVSLTRTPKHPAWMYSINSNKNLKSLYQYDEAYCRQQLPSVYVLNGALYLATRTFLLSEKAFVTEKTVGYTMPPERSVDIDNLLEFEWAEFLFRSQNND